MDKESPRKVIRSKKSMVPKKLARHQGTKRRETSYIDKREDLYS